MAGSNFSLGSGRKIAWTILGIVAALVFSSCGGRNFRAIGAGETNAAPPYIELYSQPSAGTLHFPRGLYSLDAVDDKGYYYRAPRKITQHSWSGGLPHDGGLFIEKRNRRKMRGYVILPGGLTHVGNFSSAHYEFRY